ncbi:hypothetical protein PF005_g9412 [Phytophthora fragariae]|uniref:BED-type domain-containing protein n=1 Tax=Phytophthora fragariae TaxID=53985 RepID=A0A6A3YB12_9STRA|nr:hypothetical protein PF005_g9412 [Phytophthora fragariae]
MDGTGDGQAYPYMMQREQLQMQLQQQLQAQQQPMHQMQMQQPQSRAMDGIGPAASTLMQVHSGDTSAEMHMTSAPMQHPAMHTRSSDAVGSSMNPPPLRQQSGTKRSGTLITGGEEPGVPQLYKTSKMRRPELWQFIRLVVPDPPHIAAGRTYTNQDAKEAYCLKCKRIMHYNTGSSNNVSRHMAKFHAADLASYAQEMANKKMKHKKQQDQGAYAQTSGERAGGTSSAL